MVTVVGKREEAAKGSQGSFEIGTFGPGPTDSTFQGLLRPIQSEGAAGLLGQLRLSHPPSPLSMVLLGIYTSLFCLLMTPNPRILLLGRKEPGCLHPVKS